MSAVDPPLCVDLDGTLIRGDTLNITFRLLARGRPWLLPLLPLVLLRGRPALKRFMARHAGLDPRTLPWREDVLDFVRREREGGRLVFLTTAADRIIAESVSEILGPFDRIIATDLGANLKGAEKVAAIRSALPDKDFDYIGDSRADLPVFAAARYSYLVEPSDTLRQAALSVATVRGEFRS